MATKLPDWMGNMTIDVGHDSVTVNYSPVEGGTGPTANVTANADGVAFSGGLQSNNGTMTVNGGVTVNGDGSIAVSGNSVSLGITGPGGAEVGITLTPNGQFTPHPTDPTAPPIPSATVELNLGFKKLSLDVPIDDAFTMDKLFDRDLGGVLSDGLLGDAYTKLRHRGRDLDRMIEEAENGITGDNTYRVVRYDPIALDLDGDGVIRTTAMSGWAGALFDNDGDGIRTASGWVSGSDGLLVRDLNGDGSIDTGKELFGDQTLLADGSVSQDGFQALADLDSNADGTVDASDAGFSTVKVWRDLNGDGRSSAEELFSLSDLGIVSLATGHEAKDESVAGGDLIASGTFTRVDAGGELATHLLGDFVFDSETLHSDFTDDMPLPEALRGLPDMQGMGRLRDLLQACARSPALAEAVRSFTEAGTRDEQRAALSTLLIEWAKTNPTYSDAGIRRNMYGSMQDPSSGNVIFLRPGQAFVDPEPTQLSAAEVQMVRVVEAILGTAEPTRDIWFGDRTLAAYQAIYDTFFEGVYEELATKTRLKQYVDMVDLSFSSQTFSLEWDFSRLNAALVEKHGHSSLSATVDLSELLKRYGETLWGIGWKEGESFLRAWVGEQAGNADSVAALVDAGIMFRVAGSDQKLTGSDRGEIILGLDQTSGSETLQGGGGNDFLLGGGGNDILEGGAGADLVKGDAGSDNLHGGEGHDLVWGGDGNDQLFGDAGDDRLDGGAGNDQLSGGTGSDTYVFGRGSGADVVDNYDAGTSRLDEVEFGAGIGEDDVVVVRNGNDLIFKIAGTSDTLTIRNHFLDSGGSPYRVDQVRFADGALWDAGRINSEVEQVTGTGSGDVHQLSLGSGHDIISDRGGFDTLRIGDGISPSSIQLVRQGANLVVSLAGNTDSVTLKDWFTSADYWLEQFVFADGTTWTAHDITYGRLVAGDASNQRLEAVAGSHAVIDGGDGDDVILGADGDDILRGGAGNDSIVANAGRNELHGGRGNDTLTGGARADVYVFNMGDGQDVITDNGSSSSDATYRDVVRFGAGISAADVWAAREGLDLVLTFTTAGDRITIKNWFDSPSNWIERFEFADGTSCTGYEMTYDWALAGTDEAQVLQAGAGSNAVIRAAGGNDTVTGNDGNDQLFGEGGNDTLDGGRGNDVLDGGDGDDILRGGVNSSTWNDVLRGGAGNDTLISSDSGYYTANVLEGGSGNDTMTGGSYSDRYLFNLGDGQDTITDQSGVTGTGYNDRIEFGAGISAADVQVARSGNDLVLALSNGSDQLTVKNWFVSSSYWIEQVQFADGTVWTPMQLTYDIAQAGTAADQTLVGVAGSNAVIRAGGGNDTVTGNDGNDQLFGEGGNDTLDGGRGNDVLDGGDGDDILRGGVNSSTWNDVLRGGAGNDTLISSDSGYYTANVLEGGSGNDTMTGGSYSDRYLFNLGDGQDTITDQSGVTGTGYNDRIEFGAGISAADVQVARSGNDLVLALSNGSDQLTVKNWFVSSSYWIEQVQFADGTVWTPMQLTYDIAQAGTAADQTLVGVAGSNAVIRAGGGNDTVTGNDGNDQLFGEGGNDTLDGGRGNDVLDGGDGDDILRGGVNSSTWNDVLRGGAGNDTLISSDSGYYTANVLEGGSGNDTMTGGSYSDRYLFNLGDGQDTITDQSGVTGTGYNDRIEFGAGISAADVQVARSGNDLVLALSNGSDQLTVKNWFVSSSYWIEQVQFADGTVWTPMQLTYDIAQAGTAADQTLVGVAGSNAVIRAGGGNDTVTGNDGNDQLFGEGGNDTLDGGRGNDVLDGGDGDDILRGGVNSSTWNDVLRGGAGNDTLISSDSGYYTANVLEGGSGNDTMTGGSYSDRYLFNLGDGQDTITDQSGVTGTGYNDRIEFGAGISAADVQVARSGNDLVLALSNGSDQLTVKNWFVSSSYWIEQVQFADGTVWTPMQLTYDIAQAGTAADQTLVGVAGSNAVIRAAGGNDTVTGNDGNDQLFGESGNDTLDGGRGNDVLDGGDGDDILRGGVNSSTWNDVLRGGAGNDTLISSDSGYYTANVLEGGSGNDTMTGGSYSDRYLFNLGDGQDTITDQSGVTGTGYNDRIEFGAGISAADVQVARSGNDLVLALSNGSDQLTVKNWFVSSSYWIEQVQFADGTVWTPMQLTYDIAQAGTAADQALVGVAGSNAVIRAGGGNDTVTGNDGNDQLFGESGNDTLDGGRGNDVLDGGDGDDILRGGVNSSTWNDVLRGGAGNDTLISSDSGYYTANVLEGGSGNDTMTGGSYSDRYLFNLGDGQDTITDQSGVTGTGYNDRIEFGAGISAADVQVARSGNDLVLALSNGSDQLTVKNWFVSSSYWIEQVQFADGTVWTPMQLTYDIAQAGTAADQTLVGVAGSNAVIRAGGGNDTVTGNDGNDQLFGEGGNDTLDGGRGNDVLDGGDGDDILRGGVNSSTWNDVLRGGAGNDTLISSDSGYYTANVLEGGSGNDTMTGGSYSDRYLFNLGDGQDTITDQSGVTGTGYNDRIEFGAGISAADVQVARSGNDLVLALSNGTDQITVKNWYTGASYKIELVTFADGASLTSAQVESMAQSAGQLAARSFESTQSPGTQAAELQLLIGAMATFEGAAVDSSSLASAAIEPAGFVHRWPSADSRPLDIRHLQSIV